MGPKSEVARPDYEKAEAELYNTREEDTAKRLAKIAYKASKSNSVPYEEVKAIISDTEKLDSLSLDELLDLVNIDDFIDIDTVFDTTEDDKTAFKDEMENLNKREQIAIKEMRKLITKNYLESGREYHRLQNLKIGNELMLKKVVRDTLRNNPKAVSTRTRVTDYVRNNIEIANTEEEEIGQASPEGYIIVKGLEFRKNIKELHDGRMVATPYVARHLTRVKENIAEGFPTFLHGHLGSGKTELAINAAKEATIEAAAFKEALIDYILQDKQKEDSDTIRDDNTYALTRSYLRHKQKFEKDLRNGDKDATERFAPLIVSGSKDLTSQDLFSDKTLKLTKFNGKPLLEHKKELDAEIATWQHKHPEDAKDPEKSKQEADKILELYKLKNQAFGTEVETIKKAVYRAVEEGRPVIIDEVNAIPSAVLISLNDILQRRPGEHCYIPGAGPVKIKPGFSIIMTGNLNQGNVSYFGTEDLNPAFLSRLDVIEHDYLPMSDSDPSYKEQADPSKNELFQVVLAYLADRQGNLELPEMEKSLQKIFALSQLSHETGLIFGGKWRESEALQTSSGDEVEPRLEKSVLSIRNLLNVLKEWDKGSEKDLDKALWDGFISNMTNPDDQNLMLGLAKRYGFFQESDGWHIEIKARGSGFTSLNEAHPGPFTHKRKTPEVYSVHKVIEALYGPGPEREAYPDAIELDEIEELIDDEVDLEDLEMFEQKLAEINKSIKALEILGEQCGCTNTNQDESNG